MIYIYLNKVIKLRILLINKFHYRRGGAETYYFDLGEILEKRGHEIHYFSMADDLNEKTNDEKYFVKHQEYVGAKNIIEKMKAFLTTVYSFEAKQKLEQMIMEIQPDIIHINNYHRQLSCSIFDAIKKYKIPIVMTAHDATNICPQIYMNYKEMCTECSNGKYYYCLKKKCVKNSLSMSFAGMIEGYISKYRKVYEKIDYLISPSRYLAKIYVNDGFDQNKLVVLHNAKKVEIIDRSVWENRDYGIFFGRLSKEKGILTLLEAISKVKVCSVYIVGDGPEKKEIVRFINDRDMQKKVKIIGYKTGKELNELIARAKFAILPSETPENCPYGVIEAFANGVPVIGSNLGGIPELIDNGVTGWIFNAGDSDSLAKILCKAEKDAEKMYDNCLKKAQKEYSMDYYCDQIEKLYNKVISENDN